MENPELTQLFLQHSAAVAQKLLSDELLSTFPDCASLIADRISAAPAWQVALPVLSALAAGGSLEDGHALASAWYPMYLASEILDNVEDWEFTPDPHIRSPEVATNLATSLIFLSFHTLTAIQNPGGASRAVRIFSRSGFDATLGQHRDLTRIPSSVEKSLDAYWEQIILKSGSVFRMATAGGAAAGTADEALIEAMGDYGTALGVMLQLIDDCRDAFSASQETIQWEVSLPLLLYCLITGEENIVYPQVSSKAEWSSLLNEAGVIHAIANILLEWKARALESLVLVNASKEKQILEKIPSLFLERIPVIYKGVSDGKSDQSEVS